MSSLHLSNLHLPTHPQGRGCVCLGELALRRIGLTHVPEKSRVRSFMSMSCMRSIVLLPQGLGAEDHPFLLEALGSATTPVGIAPVMPTSPLGPRPP